MTTFFNEGEIRPSTNETQELIRWLPAGVKQLFLRVNATDHLEGESAVLRAWMEEHDLTRIPSKGVHEGHVVLTETGKKVHRGLQRRMEGQE